MRSKIISLASASMLLVLLGAGCLDFGGSAAQGPTGVFRSIDRGETWLPSAALPTPQGIKSIAGIDVFRMFNDPSDPNALYVGTRGQGLFYTYSKGEGWMRVDAFSGKFIYALAVDPQNKCVIYVSDGLHMYKTIDCSRTWQLVYTEERPTEHFVSIAVDFGNSKIVYAALVGGDIVASNDSGLSWHTVKRFGFQVQHLAADQLGAGRIYVASYHNGLYRSDDGGASWVDLSQPLNAFNESNYFYRLVVHPSRKNTVFWICKYGILRSDDAGTTWREIKLLTPPGSVNIYAFAINPQNEKEIYYVSTVLGEKNLPLRSTFYKSVDGGSTWVTKKLPTNSIPISIYLHPLEPNVLFLGFTSKL